MPVIDEELKEYLDLKFGAVINEIKTTSKQHSEDIVRIDKRVNKLEIFKEDHIKSHDSVVTGRRFNIEMWIIVGIFVIDKIQMWVQNFPPAP